MAKHTPGPWYKVSRFDDELCDNRWHISQSPEGKPYWIAELFGQLPKGQEEANANLIAAAPDLLEACEKTLAEMRAYVGESEFDKSDPSQWVFDLLKAAIARAEGKEDSHG